MRVGGAEVDARPETLAVVRRAVRTVLEETPAYQQAPVELRRALARRMVDVSLVAARQLEVDRELTREARPPAPFVEAQSAGDALSMRAVNNAGNNVQSLREGLDFPGFVTSLITGVFQSIQTSSIQQLEAVSELLTAVSSSAAQFSADNISTPRANLWATQKFAFLTMSGSGDDRQLAVRDGQDLMDHTERLKTQLEATEDEVSNIDDSELSTTLIPLVKRKMGRDRQANLATMVLMGLNRVVVDEGRLHASMDMRVDARSAAEQMSREQNDFRINTAAKAQFGAGAWGASASMSASVGRVKDEQEHTSEEIGATAGLRSSVDLVFHTEPVNLDNMLTPTRQRSIRLNSRVPASWESRPAGSTIRTPPTSGLTQRTFTDPPTPPTAPPIPTTTTTTSTAAPTTTSTTTAATTTTTTPASTTTTTSTSAPTTTTTTTAATTTNTTAAGS